MKLVVPENILCEILEEARGHAPREVCGLLAGQAGRVMRLYPIPNVSLTPETRFEMEPEAQLAAMREVRRLGLELLGTYHSHPRTPAAPSPRDRRLALYPDVAHVIVSLADTDPDVRAFRITPSGNTPISIVQTGREAKTAGGRT
ncbi:MAG: M67 family metallopeptidase [Rubrobacteraceae bacterium]|nr:M67 family metallopeptidase [Rubrobacteraceae bacterium]